MEDPDPQVLWRRVGTGDRRAFAALYRCFEQDVLRFCQALLHNPDDAREAANSTWAAIWTARHAAERDVPLRPWLFRIAHNEAINILRRRHAHEELDLTMPAPDDPAADAELHERLATLHHDLLMLTAPQRTALVLKEMSGLSHNEIAGVLGISSGAARQTIYEARQALIDAEGGRSLSCELVRRELSAGDRRVLRGRRIQAHLRGCSACRGFAATAKRPRQNLRVLVPWPAGAALLARFGPAAEVTGGGATAAGLSALGAKVAGPLATKVAAATLAVAVGSGAAGTVRPRAPAPAPATAAGDRPTAAVVTAPTTPRVAQHHIAARQRRDKHAGGAAQRPATVHDLTSEPAAPRPHTTTSPGKGQAPAPSAPQPQAAPPEATPAPSVTIAPAPSAPPSPSDKARPDTHTTAPPGQAKKKNTTTAPPPPTPPGQAKKNTTAAEPATTTPPGQAKKDDTTSPAPATPPGQAKKNDTTTAPAATAPPGQAKKDGAAPPPRGRSGHEDDAPR